MKVLFIGGTGNISSAVSRLAVEQGIDLYLLNRGLKGNVIKGVKTITADITDLKAIADELRKHRWDSVVNWIAFNENDINRDINIFSGKTKQYIFISSASVYQKPLPGIVVTEATPLGNIYWDYSRDKIACEMALMKAYKDNGFPSTIVRPSLTYETVIPIAIGGFNEYTTVDRILKGKKIIVHGDGTSVWTITHSKDFAKGFIGLLGNEKALGESYHITSDEILTWEQIYEYLSQALGKEAQVIHIPTDLICRLDNSYTGTLLGDKSGSIIFDNSKIKKIVPDFKAVIPFKEGIKETLKWLDENPGRKFVNERTNNSIDMIISKYEKLLQV